MKGVKIFIGSDHAGLDLKMDVKEYLATKGYDVNDVGPYSLDEKDDYPDYAFSLGEKVSKNKESKGILVCGSGTGMTIAANKVKGIRAIEGYDVYSAEMSRKDNDSNVLSVRSRNANIKLTKRIIDTWLKTKFSGLERHKRRIRKISLYESK